MRPRSIVIDNPAEDIPRCFAAVGKACGGTFTLVMRPADDAHVLILTKGKDTRIWTSEAAGFPRVPQMPRVLTTAGEAHAIARGLAKVSKDLGPVTFRGVWRGTIECSEDGGPQIRLTRRVSSYVTVYVYNRKTKWAWDVKREGQWFKGSAESTGEQPRLGEAILAALRASVSAASEACGVRDTTRRAALDQEYAKQKPVKVPKTKADPTAKLKVKEPKAKASKVDRDVPKGVASAARPDPKRMVKGIDDADAAKDKELMALFQKAMAEALA